MIEVFQYPVISKPFLPIWDGVGIAFDQQEEEAGNSPAPEPAAARATSGNSASDLNTPTPEDVNTAREEGRLQGIQEGRRIEREAQRQAQALAERQLFEQAAVLAGEFARERDQYSVRVEPEVVRLALAVAARILRREAQMDPLMLTGAVRVAFGQLSKSTTVRLHVPQADLELWSEAMAHMPNLSVRPEVQPGEGMRTGECVVETEIGSVDLGIRAQLDEIERGFFDRASDASPMRVAADSAPHRQEECP
jgi:flagellar assembly protein FliH